MNPRTVSRALLRRAASLLVTAVLVASILLPSAYTALAYGPPGAQAVSEGWSDPVNLSRSGGAREPVLVADSSGTYHILWEDNFEGQYHLAGDGLQWDEISQTQYPFAGARPVLLTGLNGWIHAFWINQAGRLLYSRALATSLDQQGAWSGSLLIMEGVVDFEAEVDALGRIHLAVLKAGEQGGYPAGIYYIGSTPNGLSWEQPSGLFESPYLRNLGAGQANIDLASAGGEEAVLYIGWDLPARKQIYLAGSQDGGRTWGPPEVIHGPDADDPGAQPSHIAVNLAGEQDVLLTWHNGIQGACQMRTQFSPDGGQTWSDALALSADLPGCAEQSEILHLEGGDLLLLTRVNAQSYLLRWDGEVWSDPEAQPLLSSFEDPETFSHVAFLWTRAVLTTTGEILVVGYDGSGAGDVWITTRPVEQNASPAAAGWSMPELVTGGEHSLSSPLILADPANRFHFLWIEQQARASTGPRQTIAYSVSEGERISSPAEPFAGLEGSLDQLAAVLAEDGRILLAMRKAESGEVLFSQAPLERAFSDKEWTQPVVVSLPGNSAAWPALLVAPSGQIYLAYTLPVNEGRGVYVARSEDGGRTWSIPEQVIDGAGWEVVGPAKLSSTTDGALHLLVEKRGLFTGETAMELSYTRIPAGNTGPVRLEAVSERPVSWSGMVSPDGVQLFRVWEEQTGQTSVRFQYSPDRGTTWSAAAAAGIPGLVPGSVSLAVDPAGQLHLLGIGSGGSGKPVLLRLVWTGERWNLQEPALLESEGQFLDLSASATLNGDFGVVLRSTASQDQSLHQEQLTFIQTAIELPGAVPGLPVFTPTPAPQEASAAALPEPSPTPDFTPTPDLAALAGIQPGAAGGDNKWAGLAVGAGFSILFLAALFVFQAWKMSSKRL